MGLNLPTQSPAPRVTVDSFILMSVTLEGKAQWNNAGIFPMRCDCKDPECWGWVWDNAQEQALSEYARREVVSRISSGAYIPRAFVNTTFRATFEI